MSGAGAGIVMAAGWRQPAGPKQVLLLQDPSGSQPLPATPPVLGRVLTPVRITRIRRMKIILNSFLRILLRQKLGSLGKCPEEVLSREGEPSTDIFRMFSDMEASFFRAYRSGDRERGHKRENSHQGGSVGSNNMVEGSRQMRGGCVRGE